MSTKFFFRRCKNCTLVSFLCLIVWFSFVVILSNGPLNLSGQVERKDLVNLRENLINTSSLHPKDCCSQADTSAAPKETVVCRSLRTREAISDGWFEENFNQSLRPILTKENINISMDLFKWWNNLLFSVEDDYETYRDLATTLVSNKDVFHGNATKDCIRCAVVGNSGNLLKSGYGKLIDIHDVIIRMNKCPTSGFEGDVGARTTHYVAYPRSYQKEDRQEAYFVLAAFNTKDMKWLNESINTGKHLNSSKHPQPTDRDKVFILNPELLFHIKNQWGLGHGKWASTGILSTFFALQLCDEVNIFGFGANNKGNWDHYFESNDGKANSKFKATHVHDSDAESSLLQKLSEAKKVTMYRGPR